MQPIHLPAALERDRENGFTAIELMVVVAIVAILAALAMPSFRNVVDRYRVRQATEEMTATLYLARAEAIKRGGQITIRKAAPAGCTTLNAGDWSCGWTVFLDADKDGVFDAGEEELQSSPASKGVDVKLVQGSGVSFMKIDAWGQFAGLSAFSVELKPKDNTNPALLKRLCMSSGGRLRTPPGGGSCD